MDTDALPKPGQRVTFVGGTGRGDADKFIAGIVNGNPIYSDEVVTLIPVHVPETNQNVMVVAENITEVVDA